MAEKSRYRKVGALKVRNGTYMKDGVEKTRWNEIGVLFSTPHQSSMFVKFHATANGEGTTANIFYDDAVKESMAANKPMTQAQALNGGKDVVLEDIDDKPVSLEDIPF